METIGERKEFCIHKNSLAINYLSINNLPNALNLHHYRKYKFARLGPLILLPQIGILYELLMISDYYWNYNWQGKLKYSER
jgi:hypothetical protein